MCNRITKTNLASMLMIVFSLVAMFLGRHICRNKCFSLSKQCRREFLTNGVKEGDTYNYDYGNAPEANFDEENYINYENSAFVKNL